MNQTVERLIRDTSESLHMFGDGIELYSKTLSEEEVLPAVELLSDLRGAVAAAGSRRTPAGVNYNALPANFRDLVPLIERWAESDDADRDALLDDANESELLELVKAVAPRFEQINEYLNSFEGSPPEFATALGTLAECTAEAQLKLSQRHIA